MATTKPRITVTLTERQHEVLKTISDCGGHSMSGIISELLEVSLPTFERMANTFKKMRNAQKVEQAKMIEVMDDAQSVLEPIALEAINQFDLFCDRLEAAAEGDLKASGAGDMCEERARAPAPEADSTAPATNRGANHPGANAGEPASTRVSKVSKKSGFLKCTCIQTAYERQENKACPVHFPKVERHAV